MFVILTFLFGTYHSIDIILEILFSVSLVFFFRKCAVRPVWAFVPFVRAFFLGKCGDCKPEGKAVAVLDLLSNLMLLAGHYTNAGSVRFFWINPLSAAISIVTLIYRIRIYNGLCINFETKRLWIAAWVLVPFIPAFIWGLSGKYHCRFTVEEMEADTAARITGRYVAESGGGLTVNLDERVSRRLFEKKYLLRDIHMVIQPGHMVLLLGGSGAGKTTLINAINGYEKAKAKVTLNGNNVYKQYKEIQHDIGYVPQKDLMRDHDTVFRTLSDAATLRLPQDADIPERRALVREVLDIFGLEPVKNSLVQKLSGGQRKRLSIAMEYIANPSLFILDEPDSGLDGVMARELMERLRGIADMGKIVIVITHTPDRVIDLFDDVIVLAKDSNLTGRLAFFGSIEDARMFFGKDRMEQIVMSINRKEEGGEGRADEFVEKYGEVQNG